MTIDPLVLVAVITLAMLAGTLFGYAVHGYWDWSCTDRPPKFPDDESGYIEPIAPWVWAYPIAAPADDMKERRAVFVWDDEQGFWEMERWLPDDDWPLMRIAAEIVEVNQANGWDLYNHPNVWDENMAVPTAIALIHSEVSEALEDFREGDREHFGEELADVQIRLLDLAHGVGVDMDAEVARKQEINRKRSYRHGGKRV